MSRALELPENTHALQVVRTDVKNDRFVYYEAVTFPDGPRDICGMYLRRAAICGSLDAPDSLYAVDVLDQDGDVLLELHVERKAARYLIEKLKLKVEQA